MLRDRLVIAAAAALVATVVSAQTRSSLTIRGREQTLQLYGPKTGPPVVVTSGDGGFLHLAPAVAEFLASRGFFVVGVDAKAYLSSFTSSRGTLAASDVPGDYRAFIDYARQGREVKVALVGVSEGAGLSVLAAADERLQPSILGVLALGLPDVNELGWRWRDSIIYLTHQAPNEPSFRASDYAGRLGPVRLAALHSTHDEFVPVETVRRVLGEASPTRRLWLIEAADHRFSNNQPELQKRIIEALEWIQTPPR